MASYTLLPTPEANLKEDGEADYEKAAPTKSPVSSPAPSSPAPSSSASPETLAGQKFKIMVVVFAYFVISM